MLDLVASGWWSGVPGSAWPPIFWMAAPAVAATLAAALLASRSRPRALVVVMALAMWASPWLPLVLAPLLWTSRDWPRRERWAVPLAVAGLIVIVGYLLMPDCLAAPGADRADAPAVLWPPIVSALGGGALVLVAVDAVFGVAARRTQLAVAASLAAAWIILARAPGADAVAVLAAPLTLLWWRAGAGARRLIQWQPTAAGRAGVVVLAAVAPLLAAAPVLRSASPDRVASIPDVWRALAALPAPASVVATGGRADIAINLWRAGDSDAQRQMALLPSQPAAVRDAMRTRPVYAWQAVSAGLASRGFLTGPTTHAVEVGNARLVRIVDYTPCQPLSVRWTDVTALMRDGQVAGVFPIAAPLRGALVYLSSDSRLTPEPLGWPPDGVAGFEARAFDTALAADAAAFTEALDRDGLDRAAPGGARFVVRLRFDRRATAPATLPIHLGGVTRAAWARLYAGDEPPDRRPELCRSSIGTTVTAYDDAPPAAAIDLALRQAIGEGWHAYEEAGGEGFRWTAGPRADLLFVAQRPETLTLRLDAQPAAADWNSARMRVAVNGVDAACSSAAPPCDWLLPASAIRAGVNVVTLHAAPVQAPAPDPRQLGLLVRSAALHRQAPS